MSYIFTLVHGSSGHLSLSFYGNKDIRGLFLGILGYLLKLFLDIGYK